MIGWIILGVIVLFLAVILIRGAMFVPAKQQEVPAEKIEFDGDAAVKALQELVRCKTVSYNDHSLEDDGEFEKLIAKLPELYPNVCRVCPLLRLPDRALLFKWQGRSEGEAAVMMAHYDVVPVNEDKWDKPAFEGIIEDGVLWGRGSVDTKVSFNGVMSAAENLIKEGFAPEHDIYFAFSGGEEVNGNGAPNIVKWFRDNNVQLSLVLDEGGAVVEGMFPGVKESCGLIGIAEKGMINVQLAVESNGGHASAPAPHTPVGLLSIACAKLESHPFRYHITKPVAEMFDVLGRRSSFLYRVIFANLWCFGGVLDGICRKSGGDLNAMMRTTVAFTQMNGSAAPNVIPPRATMVANLRLNPQDSVESALQYVKSVVGEGVELTDLHSMQPSRISSTDCEGWKRVSDAVRATWGCIVAPYLMVQCSDSRHYGQISDRVYRFSSVDLTKEERGTIHGNNEHIRLEAVKHSVEFYIRLMKKC